LAGPREVPIALVPIDDNEVEPTESIVLELQPIACIRIFPPPADCYELGRSRVARARLLDNDRVATNQPPSVAIFTPGDGCVHVAPERLFVAASAWDLDGSVRSVEFFDGDTSLGLVSNNTLQLDTTAALSFLPPWSLSWSNITCGEHVLTAKAIDNEGAETISRPVSVRIVESNTLPVVTIRAVDAEAAELNPNPPGAGVPSGLNTATFRVHRTGPTHDDLFVIYRTDGRARAGVDCTLPGGGVTITAGHSEAEIELIPIDDGVPERRESVVIGLLQPVTTIPHNYEIGPRRKAAAVIIDNDREGPPIDPTTTTGSALDDGSVHVTLVGVAGQEVVIEVSDNMIDWFELIRTTVADGTIDFVDPEALLKRANFYRIIPVEALTTAVEAQRRF
jgi:hypothetical protein